MADDEALLQQAREKLLSMASTAKLVAQEAEVNGGVPALLERAKQVALMIEADREFDKTRADPQKWEAFVQNGWEANPKLVALIDAISEGTAKAQKAAPPEAAAVPPASHVERVAASRDAATAAVGHAA